MKWTYNAPSMGDMIRVSLGVIYHFGIYISDDEVIQFGLPPVARIGIRDEDVEVIATDIDAFLAGGFLEVAEFDKAEKKKNRKVRDVVDFARSKLGMRGYNLLYNNCEHFATECVTGTRSCKQADDLRAMLRNMPISDVYIASLPKDEPIGTLKCKERMDEINSASCEAVKREKYFAWKLLCYALERSLGFRGERLKFKKEAYGAWSVENAEISISHSEGALAVAVSRMPVGIDIEIIRAPRVKNFPERIMNENELSKFNATPDEDKESALIEIWTAKEAIFKSQKKDAFVPRDIDTKCFRGKTEIITVGGEKYALSIATATPERLKIFTDIDLSEYEIKE